MKQDTICAIATAQGGAIGMIRVSGPEAIEIVNKLFIPINKGKDLTSQKAYTLSFGSICQA
ncbi:MAG: tRNA uridine-5-carboxymethylaminomethyl(34) synthesis GTPase MnmE, partial [Bacteroidaceae bacterium]